MVDADWEITHQAALFKAQCGLSFADCYAAARGKLREAEVAKGDPEFESLAGFYDYMGRGVMVMTEPCDGEASAEGAQMAWPLNWLW
jgi:hypothetical protein